MGTYAEKPRTPENSPEEIDTIRVPPAQDCGTQANALKWLGKPEGADGQGHGWVSKQEVSS